MDLHRASELVRHFVIADTGAAGKDAEALVLALGDGVPYCELATDFYWVTDSARLADSIARGDTGLVMVEYHVLGTVRSEDPHKVGPKTGRFSPDMHIERDTFYVTSDSSGRFGISCDHHVPPNHVSPAHALSWLRALDPRSQTAWDSVSRLAGLR